MIVACDLDRTLIPNGSAPNTDMLPALYQWVLAHEAMLVYVTGRTFELYEQAQEQYGIEQPAILLAAVGTKVYQNHNDILTEDLKWLDYVKKKHPAWDRQKIVESFKDVSIFEVQEESLQNNFKISLYTDLKISEREIRQTIAQAMPILEGVKIIYSVDPHKQKGLVDILPAIATKVGALEYVREQCRCPREDLIYAGDSGNDLLVFESGYKSILVRNAPASIKEKVKDVSNVYIAKGGSACGNGNYASGVLEGLEYYLSM